MELGGKTILLTGGTDGIGRALALQLRDAGAAVIVTGRTPERIAAMAELGFATIAVEFAHARVVADPSFGQGLEIRFHARLLSFGAADSWGN